jgi:hypothetical protein
MSGAKNTMRFANCLRLILIALVLCVSKHAAAQQIWFGPPDQLPRLGGRVYGPDFMNLFEPNSPWARAQSKVQMFMLTPMFPLVASDADLTKVFAFLRAHKIALGVGMAMVPTSQDHCGFHVEGITLTNGPTAVVQRIKKLGGDLQYIGMDEPMTFGHEYTGQNACRYPISQVAAGVAEMARTVRAYFPDVQIGEAEATDNLKGPDWLARLETWLDAYQQATGRPMAFFQQDAWWDGPWRERTPPLVAALHRRGIKYGMIFNAAGDPPSDALWIAQAQQHAAAYQALMRAPPDLAVFTSWTTHPTHILPETAPTLTYLIDWYAAQRH